MTRPISPLAHPSRPGRKPPLLPSCTDMKGHLFVAMKPGYRTLILLGVGLILLGFLAINLAQGRPELLLLWCALLFNTFVSFIPLIFWRREYGWFHPLIFSALWGFLMLLMRKFPLYAFGLEAHRALIHHNPVELNLLMAWHDFLLGLGGLALLAGFFLGPKIRVPVFRPRPIHWIWLKIALVACISLVAFWVWARASGGLEGLLTIRGLARPDRIREGISGAHWVKLINLLSLALILALGIRPRLFNHPGFWMFMLLSIILNFAATGSRSSALYPLIMCLIVHMLLVRRIPYARLVATGLLIIFLLGFLGQFRSAQFGQRRTLNLNSVYEFSAADAFEEGIESLVGRATTGHGGLPILARVPQEQNLLWGRTYLAWLFFPIPSAILPFEKPMQAGRLNGMLHFGMQGGVPPGSVAEAYWNFHIPGVLVVFFLWGAFVRWFTRFYLHNATAPGMGVFYVYFIFTADPSGTAMSDWIQGSMALVLAIILFSGMPRILRWAR